MSSVRIIAILEDDPERSAVMREVLAAKFTAYEFQIVDNAPDFVAWLKNNLASCAAISLDHDMPPTYERDGHRFDPGCGRDATQYLSTQTPVCPVIIHTTNPIAAPAMELDLHDGGWTTGRVVPFNDLDWIDTAWARELAKLLAAD